MEEKKETRLIQRGVLSLCVLITAGLIVWYEVFEQGTSAGNWIRFLCDGFFVAGILMICFGGMVWISQAGGFHAITYLFYSVRYMFTANKNRFEKRKNYYEYKVEKEAKASVKDQHLHYDMLIIGGIGFAVSLVFLILFYSSN